MYATVSSPASSAFVFSFSRISRFSSRRLVLIALQECRGQRIRKAKRPDRIGRDSAFGAAFVHHDADDLDVVGRIEFAQHRLRIGHLRHGFRRYEGYRVDMFEPGSDQCLEIFDLGRRRDLSGQSLPGVAWAFDKFD